MKTEKLYYADAYMKEFDAVVVSCEERGNSLFVVLDRTAFYPEGGGQPADHGFIASFAVCDVHERDGVIVHTLKYPTQPVSALSATIPQPVSALSSAVSPPVPGASVHCVIDWDRRYDHMQQHSGEHIVSGMICAAFSCNNVGFHMGEGFVVIDYDKQITGCQLKEIEDRANRYISENHAFVELWPSPDELKQLEYRSKKELEGRVRITAFPGADCCACCGTHVRSSAEVGAVRLFSVHAFREGVRIEMMSGRRLFSYLSACYEQNIRCSQASSSKPLETGSAVEAMKQEIIRLKGKVIGLENAVFDGIAASLAGQVSPVFFAGDLDADALKKLAVNLGAKAKGRITVFSGSDGAYYYVIIEEGGDLKDFTAGLNAALNGRGGGRGGYAQGCLKASRAQIEEFLRKQKV